MKKAVIMMLSTAAILGGIGCGAKKDSNTEIIGGADAPTSIFLPSTTDEEKTDYADPMDESTYYQVMDRILGQYNFEALDWGSEVNLEEGADALISWAEDSTGRYKAFGVISEEAGCYGIILDDTIDGTDDNANYVYEEWAYTGNAEEKPKFEWQDDQLYLYYPVSEDGEVSMKTVKIDHGYDTGHMGFDRFSDD